MSAIPPPPDDFWSRRLNAPAHRQTFTALDMLVEAAANEAGLAAAARLSAARFGHDAGREVAPAAHLTQVTAAGPAEPAPADWPERLRYAGTGEWISLSIGEWGHGVGRLADRQAFAVLAPALAAQPRLVSRYLIDHYVLNFLFRDWAMLHASVLLDAAGRTLLALVGDHNTGKSTTALRLLRAGWRFLADGMLLFQPRGGGLACSGYPLGEVKLRDDVLAAFPEYAGEREQRKTVVDLRAAHRERVVEAVVTPAALQLCFVQRGDGPRTALAPLAGEEARQAVAAYTVYWDEPQRLRANSRALEQLLETARCHTLRLGADPAGLLDTLETLR
ncbi:MAG: hypothetical protein JNK29_17010 [Anaerolineales bacterium]|nr:hypothetical protein [Anaerolineales bacterium]